MLKAFDHIFHSRLLAKIRSYRIRNPLFSWSSSCLSDCFQVANISNGSPALAVIWGNFHFPLLPPVYNNVVPKVIRQGTPFLLAEDIEVVCSFQAGNLTPNLDLTKKTQSTLMTTIPSGSWRSLLASSIIAYRCFVSLGSLSINAMSISVSHPGNDLGLKHSCSFNFHEHAHNQTAAAKEQP